MAKHKEPEIYTMHIETSEGVKQHGFHLGTDFKIAETFVLETLEKPEVLSIALRLGVGQRLIKIYDYRDKG